MGKVIKSVTNPVGAITNIGTFGQVGFDPEKGFTRGVVLEAANQASGGKLSDIGNSLKGTLLGEKTPSTPDEVIDLADPRGRQFQSALIDKFGAEALTDSGQVARSQIAAQEAQALQNVKDQEMRARQLVAQRGMGRTASGISTILNQSRDIGDQVARIRAQQPGLERQLRQENLGFGSSGINQILNEQGQSKILKTGQQAGPRTGGLLPLVTAGIGGLLGGAPGAQVGLGVGQYATQMR